MKILIRYFSFLWQSTNQHGVHSPFVFDLVTKCFYDKKHFAEYSTLSAFRKELLNNQKIIEVTDFGAGSRVFKSNRRKIADIARNAGISPKRAELLFRIVRYFQPGTILEIGTSVGLGTSALSIGNPSARIITLEGCPNTAAIASEQFQKYGQTNIEVRIGEFPLSLEELIGKANRENEISNHNTQISNSTRDVAELSEAKFQINSASLNSVRTELSDPKPTTDNRQPTTNNQTPNLIYFDGNHSKAATLSYFEQMLPMASNDSVWIFDDIHWSEDMESAWEEIKRHPKVTVTIDTFQWGLVFFRQEQQKEHFIIRT